MGHLQEPLYSKPVELTARLVIVTGAGSGIGRACARVVAEHGAVLCLVDVDGPGLDATLAELPGAGHAAMVVDVTDTAGLAGLFDDASAAGQDLAGVVNAAGILTGGDPWPGGDLARMHQVLAVNVSGALTTTTLAARYPVPGERAVVNVSSSTALRPHPADPAYAASKAALLSLSRSAAAAGTGVRVNAVLPGAVRTPMLARTGDDGVADWLSDRMTMPMLTPEQVATTVLAMLTEGAHDGVSWKIEVDPGDPERVRTTVL
jgi:NAD(P)-dependent dehydrogenase (short-subunit alcohol dehydrogenase family)